VPANANLGFEPAKRALAKIAKEGRKYGASLCVVTQRPAEIDPTILSQCNTVFALRMSNDRDQEIVRAAVADTGSGMLEFLPSLGQREAIAFGDGVSLPVRIKFDELPKAALPRSSTARFSEKWQKPAGDEAFVQSVVERWRTSGSPQTTSAPDELSMSEPVEPAPNETPLRRLPPHGPSGQAYKRPAPVAGPAPVQRPAAPFPGPDPAAAGPRRLPITPPPAPVADVNGSGASIRRSGLAASLLRRKE
jgi:hypothetical protein